MIRCDCKVGARCWCTWSSCCWSVNSFRLVLFLFIFRLLRDDIESPWLLLVDPFLEPVCDLCCLSVCVLPFVRVAISSMSMSSSEPCVVLFDC